MASKKAKTKTISKKQATGNRPGPTARRGTEDADVHEVYAGPWAELLEALNDVDVPKAEYKESLDTMLSELQTRHDAVVAELAAEVG